MKKLGLGHVSVSGLAEPLPPVVPILLHLRHGCLKPGLRQIKRRHRLESASGSLSFQ